MATLSHIAVHPVKALDPVSLERVGTTAVGGLDYDRAYAFVDDDGAYVNGKQTDAVHRLRADFDLERTLVTLRREGDSTGRSFHLDEERDDLERWASGYFGTTVSLEAGAGGSRTDGVVYGSAEKTGPTLVSEATLEEVGSWFGLSPDEVRLRLRPNLVVTGVPAFWEDKLVADGGRPLEIGAARLEGTRSIPRCIVPARDPHTGEEYQHFRQEFVERRAETMPEWTSEETLDGNLYSVTVGTRIPESERGGELRIGDEVSLAGATTSPASDSR